MGPSLAVSPFRADGPLEGVAQLSADGFWAADGRGRHAQVLRRRAVGEALHVHIPARVEDLERFGRHYASYLICMDENVIAGLLCRLVREC